MTSPSGWWPPPAQPLPYGYQPPVYAPPQPRRGWALVGSVLGIVAAVACALAGLLLVAYCAIFVAVFSAWGNNK